MLTGRSLLLLGALLGAATGTFLAPAAAAQTAAAQSCPKCGRTVDATFRFCPYDGTAMPDPRCGRCGHALDRSWRFCPFDGAPVDGAAPAQPATPADTSADHVDTSHDIQVLPRPGAAPTQPPRVVPEVGERVRKSPIDPIDELFRAILAQDATAVKSLYDWDRFFADKPVADRGELVDAYVKKLFEKVRPTLEGAQRMPGSIKLTADAGTIEQRVSGGAAGAAGTIYVFTVVRDPARGWLIAQIKP